MIVKGRLAPALLLAPVLAAGCAPSFKYAPNPAMTDTQVLSQKVAVLAFRDGTEDFANELKGAIVPEGRVNFARIGHGNVFLPVVPPSAMARALADDLRASGALRSVVFLIDRNASLEGADILVDGEVKEATFYAKKGEPWGIGVDIRMTVFKLPLREVLLTRTLRTRLNENRHARKTIPEVLAKLYRTFRQELMTTLAFESGMSAPDSAPKKGKKKDASVADILKMIRGEP